MSSLQEIAEQLKKAKKVAVFTHLNPDGDALGSVFAAKAMLEELGKLAVVYLETQIPGKFQYLDSGYKTGGEETATDADTALALDCGSKNRLGTLQNAYMNAPVRLCVDHHMPSEAFGDYFYTEPQAAATAEVLYELAELLGCRLTIPACEGLYTGLSTDTGHFKYSNVTEKTFRVAAELLRRGLNHRKITLQLYDTVKLDKLRFMGAAAERIRTVRQGEIAILDCPDTLLAQYGLDFSEVEELPNLALSLAETKVSILVKDRDRGGKKISLRGKDNINLAEVAEIFGGGGHKNAAAFVVEENLEETKNRLIQIISERLEAYDV